MNPTEQFPGQQKNEKVILVLHRHWFVLVKDMVAFVLLAVVPIVIFFVARQMLGWELAVGSLGYVGVVMGAGLYYLFVWNLAFGFWLDYLLDYCVVTDLRVIDIEQSGLFNRTIAEQPLYRVQDVTTEVRGIIPTMLRYGNVYIQTASEKQRFVFELVPNPEEIAKTIIGLSEQHQKNISSPTATTYTVGSDKPNQTAVPANQSPENPAGK